MYSNTITHTPMHCYCLSQLPKHTRTRIYMYTDMHIHSLVFRLRGRAGRNQYYSDDKIQSNEMGS